MEMRDNLTGSRTGRVKFRIMSGHICGVTLSLRSGRVEIEDNLTGRRTRSVSCRMRSGHIGEVDIQVL
jgi:hypothetical protein